MTTSDETLQLVATRLEAIDSSLTRVVSLLEGIATDTHTNTQQLGRIAEDRSRTADDFRELRQMIRDQKEVSQQQATTTDRLVRLVETLIDQRVT